MALADATVKVLSTCCEPIYPPNQPLPTHGTAPLPTEPVAAFTSPGDQYFYCQPQIWGLIELNEDKALYFESTIQLGFAKRQLQSALVKICPAK